MVIIREPFIGHLTETYFIRGHLTGIGSSPSESSLISSNKGAISLAQFMALSGRFYPADSTRQILLGKFYSG